MTSRETLTWTAKTVLQHQHIAQRAYEDVSFSATGQVRWRDAKAPLLQDININRWAGCLHSPPDSNAVMMRSCG